ncbi:MAG TPA: DUF1385 domain-containing protein [Kofleriaceae bacterium]|nr:DUF1385 domain-containing protein [Kofleriaceae bacterium]
MSGGSSAAAARRPDVGGQAVIEGVMMRSPASFTVVCRRPDGAIVIKEEAWRPVWARVRFLRWPFLRGALVLLESLLNGIAALTFSANQQQVAEGDGASGDDRAPRPRSLGARAADPSGETSAATWGMVAVSLLFGIGLFVGAPHLAAWALGNLLGFDSSTYTFHLVDGGIKMALLVGYMAAISLLPDVRRVFQYHGAEHKAIFTYERNLPLTIENARAQTRFHPRCGTSFLLIVIMVSVVLFSAALTHRLAASTPIDHLLKIAIKVPLMFPVAGLAYEFIKMAGKRCETSRLARALSAPGMWLQKITTREPTDDQLEIALLSIRKTLWREAAGAAAGAARPGQGVVEVYASAADVDLPLLAA